MPESFNKFGASHVLVLELVALVAMLAAWHGRRVRQSRHVELISRGWAIVFVVFALPPQIQQALRWEVDQSLPFHLCDLTCLATFHALWTRNRYSTCLSYYWGMLGSAPSLITPDIPWDFPDYSFFMYWGNHVAPVLAAAYLVWGLGIRPGWQEFRFFAWATACWFTVMLCFNLATGSNYLFIMQHPNEAFVLKYFGPWPLNVPMQLLTMVGAGALITLPWQPPRVVASAT